MANEACDRLHPMPADTDDIEACAVIELARLQCVLTQAEITEADYSEWYWRTFRCTGRWAAPEWREGAECFD
jgi:hypothetical protein